MMIVSFIIQGGGGGFGFRKSACPCAGRRDIPKIYPSEYFFIRRLFLALKNIPEELNCPILCQLRQLGQWEAPSNLPFAFVVSPSWDGDQPALFHQDLRKAHNHRYVVADGVGTASVDVSCGDGGSAPMLHKPF
jgi:hypothetical protein